MLDEDLGNILVFKYNDELKEYQEIILDGVVHLYDLLDSNFIFLFVDKKRDRVWIWQGNNTTTRMKFFSARIAGSIRDRHGIAFKIISADEGKEPVGFKIMIGLEKEEESSVKQTDPLYEGTEEDQELLESLRREKIRLLQERFSRERESY